MAYQATSVGKMADFETLTLCISLNSRQMCAYFCKDLAAGYCLDLVKKTVIRFDIDFATHTLLLWALHHVKFVYIIDMFSVFLKIVGQLDFKQDSITNVAHCSRKYISALISKLNPLMVKPFRLTYLVRERGGAWGHRACQSLHL